MENLDARDAIPAIVDYWRAQVADSGYSAGCAVAAAALSGGETESARAKAGLGFAEWTESIEKMLLTSRVPASRAGALAALILATVEGAVIVSLAQRSTQHMEQVTSEILRIIDATRV